MIYSKPPKNMYYRRKVALAILELAGGKLGKTDLQKLVFLFSRMQDKPVYDFFPYKFGCFSLQLDQDLLTLEKYGYLQKNEDGWNISRKNQFLSSLTSKDQDLFEKFNRNLGTMRGKELIRHVYLNFPYYAIHSEILESVLDGNEVKQVIALKKNVSKQVLYTIGYEGKSAETFTNQLIQNDVRILCDIRKNPISMKFGFSKNKLKWIVEAAGIQYIHLPGLGIESNQRQSLDSVEDYKSLFQNYKKTVLKQNQTDQETILNLWKEFGSIALTCFEADHNCCHRSYTANAIREKANQEIEVMHV